MRRANLQVWLVGFLIWSASSNLMSQNLVVNNIRFIQNKDSRVVVFYDLIGYPAKKYTVKLSLFLPDQKKLVPLDGMAITGDVGRDIFPGKSKRIIWDLPIDFPEGLEGDGFIFVVDVCRQKKSYKWPWLVIGLGTIGGGTYYLRSLRQSNSEPPVSYQLKEPPPFP